MSSGDFVSQALTSVGGAPGINTDSTQVVLITTGFSGAAITISGTFVGTVKFWATADGGANWSACNVTPSNSSTIVTSATAPGLFLANVSGFTHVSAQLSALTSGSPTVSIHCSTAAASGVGAGAAGGGGGGGGPTISLTTTGTTGASTYNTSTGALNVPNYKDISHIVLTNTGTSGASTYNTSTGTLNVPNYLDISHIALTNTGTTGAATYNTSTGALNIPNYADISHLTISNTGTSGNATLTSGNLNVPIYASGAINQVVLSTPSNYTTSSTSAVSTGFGLSFTPQNNANAFVLFNCLASNVVASGGTASIQVLRAAGAIPAAGAAVGGSDVLICSNRLWAAPVAGSQYTNIGVGNDTGITPGTLYNYYFAMLTTAAAGALTLYSGSILQVTEVK